MDKLAGRMGWGALGMAGMAVVPAVCLYNVDGGERVVMFNRITVLL